MVNHLRFQYNVTFPYILFLVYAEEHVLGIINLLPLLGRIWVSFHHCFTALGHGLWFPGRVLLSKRAFLSDP